MQEEIDLSGADTRGTIYYKYIGNLLKIIMRFGKQIREAVTERCSIKKDVFGNFKKQQQVLEKYL